ncbi:Vitamin B12 dependent methionine synthase, activation domain protein [Peptacetobacter hominis]|uniref:Vitamin B12 dependent methionine synthase, activation domain protein n=1 Tax=Peptacetobacter hominis TaxID=2743610 RepID=A0A544QV22_9FIRM|nr:vitamin B12 dependent-methionine synthase activation domain-containing protein [Peptacetobacter hominis]TQQ84527.1 Vitamin B12 dependent methionine synthase, activation domain protein [Peptacetobacter hominis]
MANNEYINPEIDREEVLRYLCYRGQKLEDDFSDSIDRIREKTKSVITPRAVYEKYPIEIHEHGVEIKGTNLVLDGKDIKKLLRGCRECILLAATIGVDIEREIRKREYSNLSESLIMDSCATTAIEEVCDIVQAEIENNISKSGMKITMRYSPGYGDLPIYRNTEILNVLQAQKRAGITINSSGIMIPRKSVAAVIGIYNPDETGDIKSSKKSCKECRCYSTCVYRRESGGFCCGNQGIS